MIIDPTTSHNSVLCDQRSIAEMIDEIRSRYESLDLPRRHLFFEWLRAHNSRVKSASNVLDGLAAWLESMPPETLRWEFNLIMTEINWWCHLDEQILTKILMSHLTKDGAW